MAFPPDPFRVGAADVAQAVPTVMVFDSESGNAIDSFPYTADELRRRADKLDGCGSFTVEPSHFLSGHSWEK